MKYSDNGKYFYLDNGANISYKDLMEFLKDNVPSDVSPDRVYLSLVDESTSGYYDEEIPNFKLRLEICS